MHPVAPITTLPERPDGVVPKNNAPDVCPSPITIFPVVEVLNNRLHELVDELFISPETVKLPDGLMIEVVLI